MGVVSAADNDRPVGLSQFALGDARGKIWQLSDFQDSPLLVITVLGTECPLAKLYAVRLQQLSEEFAPKGVTFIGINGNSQDSLSELAAFSRLHGLSFPLLKDVDQKVLQELQAERTPETFVLDQKRMVRYRGRIDDQHSIGAKSRSKPEQEELRDALNQLLAGQPVKVAKTSAVGCLISLREKPNEQAAVTYSRDIAPILQKHCVECHRTGQIAPFALTEYDKAAGWSEMILEVTRQGRMPPWHADPEHGQFANRRGLSAQEQQLIKDWVLAGAPEGNPAELPPARQYVEGWQLPRQPDLVIAMSDKPHVVPAEGEVQYQYFRLETDLKEDRWVSAAEVVPGNRSVVHHVIVYCSQDGKSFDAEAEFLAAYVPGLKPQVFPKGMAKKVSAGSKLIFQVHYTSIGSVQEDISKIGLVFADSSEVTHEVHTASVRNRRLDIAPFLDNQKVESNTITIPRDALLLSLMPHMHVRGKSFRYEILGAGGRRQTLLNVPHYDFNWQTGYELEKPLLLPRGTRIKAFASYDNSAENPANPDPSARVSWGDQSWDEMMLGYFDLAVPRDTDLNAHELRRILNGRDPDAVAQLLLKRLDKDGDGVVDSSEVSAAHSVIFLRLDRDHNGKLDEAEFRKGLQSIRQLLDR